MNLKTQASLAHTIQVLRATVRKSSSSERCLEVGRQIANVTVAKLDSAAASRKPTRRHQLSWASRKCHGYAKARPGFKRKAAELKNASYLDLSASTVTLKRLWTMHFSVTTQMTSEDFKLICARLSRSLRVRLTIITIILHCASVPIPQLTTCWRRLKLETSMLSSVNSVSTSLSTSN